MKTKSIHVRLPPKVFEEAQRVVDEGLFSSLNEFVKESVRAKVEDHKKRKALDVLSKHYGSKKVKHLSEGEKEEILEQFLRERASGRDVTKELKL
ncbi:MAG: ribbon-helix-helix domain-containing protein [Candidatus Hydrothermarchaeota archaeon]|nr:ribbon-helix-helix domain-containing protein [Candidatus Hydrothermarchaeota archaeon]